MYGMHNRGLRVTNRREFLRGATAAALPLVAGAPLAIANHVVVAPVCTMALIDDRHAEARAFGDELAGRGVRVRAVPEGDVSAPWREWIGPALRRAPTVLVGLTGAPALFCLEQLGWVLGARVVFYAEHLVSVVRPVVHRIIRAPSAVKTADEMSLSMRGRFWPSHLAALLAVHSAAARHPRAAPTHIDLAPSDDAQRLASWIIAPV
jgi:hypothetical protein